VKIVIKDNKAAGAWRSRRPAPYAIHASGSAASGLSTLMSVVPDHIPVMPSSPSHWNVAPGIPLEFGFWHMRFNPCWVKQYMVRVIQGSTPLTPQLHSPNIGQNCSELFFHFLKPAPIQKCSKMFKIVGNCSLKRFMHFTPLLALRKQLRDFTRFYGFFHPKI